MNNRSHSSTVYANAVSAVVPLDSLVDVGPAAAPPAANVHTDVQYDVDEEGNAFPFPPPPSLHRCHRLQR
jgi:hypothetical protein